MPFIERLLDRLTSGPVETVHDFETFFEGMRGKWPVTAAARLVRLDGKYGLEILATLHNQYRTDSYYRLYFYFDSVNELSRRIEPFLQAADEPYPSVAGDPMNSVAKRSRALLGGVPVIDSVPVSQHPAGRNRYKTMMALTWGQDRYWINCETRRGTVQLPLELLQSIHDFLPQVQSQIDSREYYRGN